VAQGLRKRGRYIVEKGSLTGGAWGRTMSFEKQGSHRDKRTGMWRGPTPGGSTKNFKSAETEFEM